MATARWRWALRGVEWMLVLVALATFGIVGVDFVREQRESVAAHARLRGDPIAATAGLPPAQAPAAVMETEPEPESESEPQTEPSPPAARERADGAARVLVGELFIPAVDLTTLVYDVPNPAALRHAAGRVRGTALPWQTGNSAVAGHRDSVFRQLRNVRPGDSIQFVTPYGTFAYEVTRAFVVYPEEVWVLEKDAAALTLITCFPFRWVGSAPERWVVQAKRISS